ncbi:DUF433 domain-containing protein [Pseudomonas aeruginosa]|uniref:DUF433 domain-containing protein n=1 Tax=Pseudomonas aeruginosa TaxID=287 RepID=UPI001AE090FB|nr:DUF433 domain-containing protein [Pseudomonas aeruginosa]MDU0686157.1 DUF433 domain-containing protein [Pseudomonas aeruginosa]
MFDDVITIDPEIMGGQPIFKGTRIPVEMVAGQVDIEEILEDYPSLTRQKIELGRDYLAANPELPGKKDWLELGKSAHLVKTIKASVPRKP